MTTDHKYLESLRNVLDLATGRGAEVVAEALNGATAPRLVDLCHVERIARGMEAGGDWHPDHPAYVRWLGQVLTELWAADKALDIAQDAVAEAKRATGNWRVNPLGHGHPAVIAVREAKERRRAAIAAIEGGP